MKLHLILVCIAIVSMPLTSCKKDNSSTPTKMSATVSGKAWDTSIRVATLQNSIFVVTGTSLSGEVITITIKGETIGTYNLTAIPPITQCAASYTATLTPGSSDIYASIDGKVVLTKVDKTAKLISGTFEFTLTNNVFATKSITNGQFNDLTYL